MVPLGYMPGHACRVCIKVVGELQLAQPGGPAGSEAAVAAGARITGAGPRAATTAPAPGPCPAAIPAAPSQPSTISHPTVPASYRFPTGPVLPVAGTVPPLPTAGFVPATLAFRQGEGLGDLLGEGAGMQGLPTAILGLPTTALSSAAAAAGAAGPAGADQPAGGALGPDVGPLLGDDRQVGLGEPFRL